jgi:hypothetical protein
LTSDFWAENGKRKMTARVKAIDSVVSLLVAMISYGVEILVGKGSRDGASQSASGFFAALRMTAATNRSRSPAGMTTRKQKAEAKSKTALDKRGLEWG